MSETIRCRLRLVPVFPWVTSPALANGSGRPRTERTMAFHSKNGELFCEALKVRDIITRVSETPFYLYSLAELRRNYGDYLDALSATPAIIAYALKANSNLTLLRHLRELGSGAVLVSANELRLAREAGFDPQKTLFNGNGKTQAELAMAVEHGVMINVDSEFDLGNIEAAARDARRTVDVLLRINPDIDPRVHPYVSTGIRESKFGVRRDRLEWFVKRIGESPFLELIGVHCHLGSTIDETGVFEEAARLMNEAVGRIRSLGFNPKFLNIGGGLGIDYERTARQPTAADLVVSIRRGLPDGVTLIIEPGRSIVGSAGVLVCRVIGVKSTGAKKFIVVDGSMTELIRPSLYDAFHEIDFVEPIAGKLGVYDVVGPVCESADYLGKSRRLPTPPPGAGLVVRDAGAYGYVMSSNYNARMRPAEYMVDADRLVQVRRPERFEDYMTLFDVE